MNIDFCGKFNIKNEYFADIHRAEKQHKRRKHTVARGKAAGQRQNSGVGGAEGAEGKVKLGSAADIYFCEYDGIKNRKYMIYVMGE